MYSYINESIIGIAKNIGSKFKTKTQTVLNLKNPMMML